MFKFVLKGWLDGSTKFSSGYFFNIKRVGLTFLKSASSDISGFSLTFINLKGGLDGDLWLEFEGDFKGDCRGTCSQKNFLIL